jgi:cell division protein FtsQ
VKSGGSHDPCSGVNNQGRNQSRPLIFEDETPPASRFRRVQAGVPPNGRALPGMPLEMRDPEDDDSSRFGAGQGGDRFKEPAGPWWRPKSTAGRVFLGLGVFLVLGSFTAAVLSAKTFLSRDSRFRISGAGNIAATGLTQVSRAEMLPVFGEDIGRNIFFVPLNERRKQLEAIPWVKQATVMRLLPDQIRISVVEREPVAFVRHDQQIGLVDADGVLLTMPPAMMAQHHYSFPVVTGVRPGDPLSMRQARMAVYGRLIAELDANNQHLSEQISEIDLTDPQDARVLMPEQGTDILGHFGDDRFLERYQRYKAHIAEWRQQYPKLAAVDLRYDNQVVLEMTPGTNAVAAAVGDSSDPAAARTDAPAKPQAGTEVAAASAKEPVTSKPVLTKPAPSLALAKAPETPAAVAQNSVKQTQVKETPVKQAAVSHPKTSTQTNSKVEMLAAKQRAQRAARERAAKLRAAHEKAQRDKKHAVAEHTAVNVSKPKNSQATHVAANHADAAAAQGQ